MSLERLFDRALPLDRSDAFFSATVLPMLVTVDDFRYFGRLTDLAGLGRMGVDAMPDSASVEFFTDYSVSASAVGRARERFMNAPRERHPTSAIAYLAGPPRSLLAIDVRMFSRPSIEELQDRIASKLTLVDFIASRLSINPRQVALVTLVPGRTAAESKALGVPVLTWEQVLAAFGDVAPPYYVEVLRQALDRYDELVERPRGRASDADMRLSGLELYERYHQGTLDVPWMQRDGGLWGSRLQEDIDTGRWRTQRYDCRTRHIRGDGNWFTVADFVSQVDVLDRSIG